MTQLGINFETRPREPLRFDGETLEEGDGPRLSRQLLAVRSLMADGAWRTLAEIAEHVGASEASVSARLRDLRKERFGAMTVERSSLGRGLFRYRVTP